VVKNNRSLMNWKIENFTFEEAADISVNFENEKLLPNNHNTLGPFDLASFSVLGNIDFCLSHNVKSPDDYTVRDLEWEKYIKRYINHKLSI
jgi:hypothetical protein